MWIFSGTQRHNPSSPALLRIDRSNALGALLEFGLFGAVNRDIVRGTFNANGEGVASIAPLHGNAIGVSSAGGEAYDVAAFAGFPTTLQNDAPKTVYILAQWSVSGSHVENLCVVDNGYGWRFDQFNNTSVTFDLKWGGVWSGGGGTAQTVSMSNGEIASITAAHNGTQTNGVRYFKNGVLLAEVGALVDPGNWSASPRVRVGNHSGGSGLQGNRYFAVLVFRGQLGDALVKRVHDNPFQVLAPLRRRLYFFGTAGGQIISVGQALETDLAQAIALAPQRRLVAQAAETDTAQAITRHKALAIGQALETDLAQAVTHAKGKLLGQATETDTAQTITSAKAKLLGQTTETDAAQAITVSGNKIIAVGQVTETDAAQALTARKSKTLGQTTETDLAQAVAHAKAKLLGQVTETDVAQAITASIPNQVGQVLEADLAQPLSARKAKALGQVAESDVAQAVTAAKTRGLGLALEIDLGQPITFAPMHRLVAQATETDLAQAITAHLSSVQLPQGKRYAVGPRLGYRVGPRNNFRVDE